MSKGYIKLHRSIRDNPVWYGKGRRYKFAPGQAFVDLCLMADHEDSYVQTITGETIQVKRGEVFTSQRKLAGLWNWHPDTVKAFLIQLQNRQMVGHKSNRDIEHGYTIITINNYDKYQGINGQNGHKVGHQLGTYKNIYKKEDIKPSFNVDDIPEGRCIKL